MNVRSLALASVASAALFASGALAADLPMRAPAPSPMMMAPIFSWTGFYAGVHAGYANPKNRSSVNYEGTQPGGAFPANGTCESWSSGAESNSAAGNPCYPYPLFVPFNNTDITLAGNQEALAAGIADGYLPTHFNSGSDGVFMGGVQLGYNHQVGAFVFGAEVDWSYLGAKGSSVWEGPVSGDFNRGITYSTSGDGSFIRYNSQDAYAYGDMRSNVDWLGTARLRLGFAVDRMLIFATGGLAFGEVKSSGSVGVFSTDGGDPEIDAFWSGKSSKTQAGWALGGGVEWAFAPNWSLKAEYLHYDLGDTSYNMVASGAVGGGGNEPRDGADYAVDVRGKSENSGDIFRVGLNYRFGGAAYAAPVVASY